MLLEVFTHISVSLFALIPEAFVHVKLIVPIAPADAARLVGVPGGASIGALVSWFKILGNLGGDIV